MEYYAQALLIAIPVSLVLVAIELLYGYKVKKMNYNLFDTLSSLSSGMTNVIKDSLGLAFVLVSYPFVKETVTMLVELESGSLLWIVVSCHNRFCGILEPQTFPPCKYILESARNTSFFGRIQFGLCAQAVDI